MNIGETIRVLRTEKGITQKDLANKLSISPSTIGMYEQNRRVPDINTISKIATIFNVTIDYLIRETDIKQIEDTNSDGFFFFFFDHQWSECKKRICARLQELSISETDFMAETNIDLEKEISLDELITITKKLNISTDYILGASDVNNYITPENIDFFRSITQRECNLIQTFRKLNEDNKDIVIGEIKKTLKEQRYEGSVAVDKSLVSKPRTNKSGKSLPSNSTEGDIMVG